MKIDTHQRKDTVEIHSNSVDSGIMKGGQMIARKPDMYSRHPQQGLERCQAQLVTKLIFNDGAASVLSNQELGEDFESRQFMNRADSIPPHMSQSVLATIQLLREAHDSASKFGRDSWDFAIELSQLVDAGISTHVLRLLVCNSWIAHKLETTDASQTSRTFGPETDLVFSDRTCFVITKLGYQFVTNLTTEQLSQPLTDSKGSFMSTHHSEPKNGVQTVNLMNLTRIDQGHELNPIWDRNKRELRVGNRVVKRFKWPAENQERVLDAFQNKGWPQRIDDP